MLSGLNRNILLSKNGFLKVFSRKPFLFSALILGLFLMFLAAWFSNISLFLAVLFSDGLGILEKMHFAITSFGIFSVRFTLFSTITTAITSFMFSFNMLLMYYYIKNKGSYMLSGGMSIGGVLSGFLGIGCASCGSLVLSLFGFSGAVLALPFGGAEFNILAILLLFWSCFETSRQISKKVCEIS